MAQIKLTQVRSTIKRPQYQKDTIKSLGLGKINQVVIKELNPQILGMVKAVSHLIIVEEA